MKKLILVILVVIILVLMYLLYKQATDIHCFSLTNNC